MSDTDNPFSDAMPESLPCCYDGTSWDCVCGAAEKVLRAYAFGALALPPMTAEQRRWCAEEADDCAEGAYDAATLLGEDDATLARLVLSSWSDYAESQGMG